MFEFSGARMQGRSGLILPSTSAFAAGILSFVDATTLAGSEAAGGRLTGPLIELCLAGAVGLLICVALLLVRWPLAALVTPVAALLCLPLLLYRIAQFSLAWLTDAPTSVASARLFNFDPLAIAGLAALIVAAVMSLRGRVSAQ